MRQMPARAGRVGVASGEAAGERISDEAGGPRHATGDTGSALINAMLAGENLQLAWKRVKANKGAAGVDGLDITQTARQLMNSWHEVREQLVNDFTNLLRRSVEYNPKPTVAD
jgi:hypothetical protein